MLSNQPDGWGDWIATFLKPRHYGASMHAEHKEMTQARRGSILYASRNAADILLEALGGIVGVIFGVGRQRLNQTNPEKLCGALHLLYLGIESPCHLFRR
jgi:hypothetical protein